MPMEEEIKQLGTDLKAITDQMKTFAEDVKKKMDSGETVSAELKQKADKALVDSQEIREKLEKLGLLPEQILNLDGRTKELELRVSRRPTGDGRLDAEETPGDQFVKSEQYKAAQALGSRFRGRVSINMKAVTSSNFSVEALRIPAIVPLTERRMTIRDLLTPGRTNSSSVQFVRETAFTNSAAAVAENTTKPESTLDTTLITANVATIAHWILASKQVLEDAPMLQSHIDGRLRYGLLLKEEDQLLNGDGTGANVHGIIPQAADYSPAFVATGPQRIDTIRLALLQAELAEYPATGIVLHPTDWAKIELTKDSDNRYIFVQPQNETQPRLWGRPVVATQSMDLAEFLVGAFKLGAQIFDREDANVQLSTEDDTNFRKNMVTLLAEERLALAVYRPTAFVHGEFGDAS